jgi:hypothetical protein
MNDMALNRQYAVIIGEPWQNLQAERVELGYMAAEEKAMHALVASEAKRHDLAMAEIEKNQKREAVLAAREEKIRLQRAEKDEKAAAKNAVGTAPKQRKAPAAKPCCVPTCQKTAEDGVTLSKCKGKGCKIIFCSDCAAAHEQHFEKFH